MTMTTGALPLIPTTVCGSHGLPAWLHLVREAAAAGRLGPVDLQECYDDAVRIAMRDQVESGVDVISDGDETVVVGSTDEDVGVLVVGVDVVEDVLEVEHEITRRVRRSCRG